MKIALVTPYDWSMPGGVNNHVRNLAQQFIRSGHQVRVFAPSSRRIEDCESYYVTAIGRSTIGLPASGSTANVTLSYNLAPRVKRLLEREPFDIVHLHEPFMPMLPFQFIRFSRSVNIATFHATREGGSRLYAYSKFLLEPWWPKLHGRVAVSRAAMGMISKYLPGPYHIIPNGIDYPFFAANHPPLPHFMDGKRNILFLGRQEKRKGLPHLLEAYRLLKKEMNDLRLIVVGPDGGLRAACQRFVQTHCLTDVHFAGFVPYEDLARFYKTATVFCAPNTGHESFGIVLLEAMAAGTPIVASDIEGFADVITHGQQGLLVPPRDSEKLAAALKRLLLDDELREQIGERAVTTAKRYSWERIAGEVLCYYEEAMTAHRRSRY